MRSRRLKSNTVARQISPAAGAAFLAWTSLCAADVAVRVDANVAHQTIEGFGATTISLAFGPTDNVPVALRTRMIDAVYNQVRLNMGNLEIGPFESPASALYSPANDDADPNTFNLAGFNWMQSDNMVTKVVTPAKPFGFDNFWLGPAISETYEFAWAKTLRTSNYNTYLDECGEHIAALAIHWRDAYGVTPRFMQLWNEPLSGNGELAGGSSAELVDIVKRAGARLRTEGFATMKFVVPAEETEDLSLQHATSILADPVARPFVGAIAYHPYPYGSTYASVPNILATSGAGTPVASRVMVRNQLRDLGMQYGIPVMMVEVSHSEVAFGNFDGMRGRAIQIHDEMIYADAAAFFGMNAMWDSVTQAQHFAGRPDPGLFSETDSIVLADVAADKVYITEMGRAIGQYARWVPRGAIRLDAASDDPLVQVTAFKDGKNGRMVLVAINNAATQKTMGVTVAGVTLRASVPVAGEQSTSAAYWTPITGLAATATGYSVGLPALSVTTLAVPIAGPVATDAGRVDATTADGSTADSATAVGSSADASSATMDSDIMPGTGFSDAGATDGQSEGSETATDARTSWDGQASGAAPTNGSAGCGCSVPSERDPSPYPSMLAAAYAIALGIRRKRYSPSHASQSRRAFTAP